MRKEEKKKPRLDIHVDLRKEKEYHPVVKLNQVYFPYAPYPQQIDIVETIQKTIKEKGNALIESPTGTGKTICLLVGALSSLIESESRQKIYYLTRTHSQISQVVSEFKKTVYSCHLNIIASREQFCINYNLSKLKGKILQKACSDLCFQKLCTYREFPNPKRPRQAMDLQQFKDHCRKEMVCPYFYSKQLTEKCQLTILPFNYLLEWNLLEKGSIDLKDSVIIFDQAHNIDSLCQQGSDIRLTVDLLSQVVSELRSVVKAQNSKTLHPQFRDKVEDRQLTVDLKVQVELLMNKLKNISSSDILSRHDILEKIQNYTTTEKLQGIDLGNYEEFLGKGKKVVKIGYKKDFHCQNLQLLLAVFEKIFQVLSSLEQFNKFSLSISKTQLLFRCLDPSICFDRIVQSKPRSIILSSGTLGDLDLWQQNLKVKFHTKMTAQSFITQTHLYSQIRAKSQNGTVFNFSFQGKQNDYQFQQLARQLRQLENIINGGIVVAFSSYELLERVLKYGSILSKKVFFETKGANIDQIYSEYQRELSTNTAFLFIVIKGRFSQGINFTAQLCRCLAVVGIPFLPLKVPAVTQKMKYLEQNSSKKQAEQWYINQSFKALNQTLGRAIRNHDDYAVILLFDQRYTKEENTGKLSNWFSHCLRPISNGLGSIKEFLCGASENVRIINSRTKTSSKMKKQLTICQRMAEFSTPSKQNKKPRKLKLILETEEETEKKQISLKEIKIAEEHQFYPSMKKEQQDFFIGFGDIYNSFSPQIGKYLEPDSVEHQDAVSIPQPHANIVTYQRSNTKYNNSSIDF